jgi:hypothetical protein
MRWVVNATPRPLYPRERPSSHCTGPQARFLQGRKTSPPPGFDPRTVQPVASRYTDYAIPVHECDLDSSKMRRPRTGKKKLWTKSDQTSQDILEKWRFPHHTTADKVNLVQAHIQYIYIYMYIYIYTYTYIHTYIHTHTHTFLLPIADINNKENRIFSHYFIWHI